MYEPQKILRFPERLAEWMRVGHTTVPIGIDLHPTNRCPHNCPACNGKVGDGEVMPTILALRILKEFAKAGGKAVQLCGGGEPLAHTDGVLIAEQARNLGLSVGLITNLYKLEDSEARRLTQTCTWIRVSLDAGTPETYSRTHGVDRSQFEGVLERIALLATQVRPGCKVGVGFLTDASTIPEIPLAIESARITGADYIAIRPYSGDTTVPVVPDMDFGDFRVIVGRTKYNAERHYGRCHARHFWGVVSADGLLRACCETPDKGPVLGDLKDRSFADVWRNAGHSICGIDVRKCPVTCRMNANNNLLQGIVDPMEHEEHI